MKKLTHPQKKTMARKMMSKLERKTAFRISIPKFPRGTMISRVWTSDQWMKRKLARAGQFEFDITPEVANEGHDHEVGAEKLDKGSPQE